MVVAWVLLLIGCFFFFGLYFFVVVILSLLSIRNHGPSIGQVSPDQILLATGIYFLAGPPAAATPPRTPGARLQSHCKQTPFYMLEQFSSSHIQMRVPARLLRSYDHSAAGSLYVQDRPGHHHLNP